MCKQARQGWHTYQINVSILNRTFLGLCCPVRGVPKRPSAPRPEYLHRAAHALKQQLMPSTWQSIAVYPCPEPLPGNSLYCSSNRGAMFRSNDITPAFISSAVACGSIATYISYSHFDELIRESTNASRAQSYSSAVQSCNSSCKSICRGNLFVESCLLCTCYADRIPLAALGCALVPTFFSVLALHLRRLVTVLAA